MSPTRFLEDLLVAEAPPIGELEARRPFPARLGPKGNLVYKLVTTTDHKLIGIMYCVACFIFFFIGGLMALFMRTELALPGCSSCPTSSSTSCSPCTAR